MSKTLEEWIELYNKKVPEKFERDERFELFYSPKYGFCEIGVTKKMVVVNQLCGDLRKWRSVLEEIAKIYNLRSIITSCLRSIRPYIKLAGFSIRGTEETEEGLRFLCEDFTTGQIALCSPAWIMPNGRRAYYVSWRGKQNDV